MALRVPAQPSKPLPEQRRADETFIDVGSPAAARHLGFGWSRGERIRGTGGVFQWVKRLEADVWFDVADPADTDLWLRAAPLYLQYQRQNIGVYVNGRFLKEWVCPDKPDYTDYHLVIPAEALKVGRNRLILRMGYRKRMGRDQRELALAVDTIVFRPRVR
jgi:hypothetical protein